MRRPMFSARKLAAFFQTLAIGTVLAACSSSPPPTGSSTSSKLESCPADYSPCGTTGNLCCPDFVCAAEHKACVDDTDCCTGLACNGGDAPHKFCIQTDGPRCHPSGASCDGDSDCCDGLVCADDGTCGAAGGN